MKEYTFWYTEEVTYKAGFKAESAEQALELLKGIQRSENDVEDLPEFWHKSKDFSVNLALDTFVLYNSLDGKV